MLGSNTYINDTVIWVDGQLSKAFRLAQAGKPAVLLIDELLRIPSRERSILISSLVPDNTGHCCLNTGRVINVTDGVGELEVLRAKTSNLWVIATTNVGAKYNVEELGNALSDRFVIAFAPENKELIVKVLGDIIKRRKFDDVLLGQLLAFSEAINSFVKQGQLQEECNLRHLAEILEHARSDTDIVNEIQRKRLSWIDVDMFGNVDKGGLEILDMVISDCF